MNADAVAHAKLDVVPIEHRHFLFFGEGHGIGPTGIALLGPAVKNRLAVRRLHAQLRLKEPGHVA